MDSGANTVIAQEEEPIAVSQNEPDMTPSEQEIETIAVWIEEHLLYLNADGIGELAKTLKIRRGRLKTEKGLKSKFHLLREVRRHLDNLCAEDSAEGMEVLKSAKRVIIELKQQSYYQASSASGGKDDRVPDVDKDALTDIETPVEDNIAKEGQINEVKSDEDITKKAEEMFRQMTLMHEQLQVLIRKSVPDGGEREKKGEVEDGKKDKMVVEDINTELFCPRKQRRKGVSNNFHFQLS